MSKSTPGAAAGQSNADAQASTEGIRGSAESNAAPASSSPSPERELLRRCLTILAEPAGMTSAIALDKESCANFFSDLDHRTEELIAEIRAILSAPAVAPQQDMVMVPREPTLEECFAAGKGPGQADTFREGGLSNTPEERARFESYMRGHCWGTGRYDDTQQCYDTTFVRMLYGVWRDRGLLAAAPSPAAVAQSDRPQHGGRPMTLHEIADTESQPSAQAGIADELAELNEPKNERGDPYSYEELGEWLEEHMDTVLAALRASSAGKE